MTERSRREVLGLLTAGAAASLLTKPAFAQATGGAAKMHYVSVTVGAADTALLAKVSAAITEALGKSTTGPKIGGVNPASEWSQDGGWYRDVTNPWSQSGGWVRDLQGKVGRLSEVEARSSPQLANVRTALVQAQVGAMSASQVRQ